MDCGGGNRSNGARMAVCKRAAGIVLDSGGAVGIMLLCLAHWAALAPPVQQHLCTSFAAQEQDLLFLDKWAASGHH